MPLAYDEEHVQLRQLLCSLQLPQMGVPWLSRGASTSQGLGMRDGGRFEDWYRDSFGEKWYWEIEQKCTNLLSITIPEVFKSGCDGVSPDDFRPNLTAFRDRCHKAYLAPKTKRTPELYRGGSHVTLTGHARAGMGHRS